MKEYYKLLKESLDKIKKDSLNEKINRSSDRKKDKKDSSGTDLKAKHKRVESLLSNNIFNHAGIMEKLWGNADDTSRSLFRKKLHREENENGDPYEFSDEELSEIMKIMMNTSMSIRKTYGNK